MATTHYEINWVFDGKAEELFDQEGLKTHSVTTATYPAIPAVGDSICWDWIADGKRFMIVARTFIWRSPEKLFVELRLDLPGKIKPQD